MSTAEKNAKAREIVELVRAGRLFMADDVSDKTSVDKLAVALEHYSVMADDNDENLYGHAPRCTHGGIPGKCDFICDCRHACRDHESCVCLAPGCDCEMMKQPQSRADAIARADGCRGNE